VIYKHIITIHILHMVCTPSGQNLQGPNQRGIVIELRNLKASLAVACAKRLLMHIRGRKDRTTHSVAGTDEGLSTPLKNLQLRQRGLTCHCKRLCAHYGVRSNLRSPKTTIVVARESRFCLSVPSYRPR
jgi:hypothetical protein